MNNTQKKIIDRLKKDIILHDGNGKFSDKYEYKKFSILENKDFVFIESVVGLKDDKGTAASMFCRTRRHISVGKRGGVKLLNAVNRKYKYLKSYQKGYWNAVHKLTL